MDLEYGACLDRVTCGLPGDHIPGSTNVNLVPYSLSQYPCIVLLLVQIP
jgi:hypothetical protein